MRRLQLATLLNFNLVAQLFSNTQVFFLHNVYEMSLFEAPIWLLLSPAIAFYILYALYGIIAFVIATSKYAHIRQKAVIGKLSRLNRRLGFGLEERPKTAKSLRRFWRQFISLNRTVIGLCSDIEAFSRYWRHFLTILFGTFITMQCYLAYIVFFIPSLTFVQKYIFIYVIVEVDFILFFFIHYCAKLVKANGRIEGESRQFYVRFLLLGGGFEGESFLPNILKVYKNYFCNFFSFIFNFKILICRQIGCKQVLVCSLTVGICLMVIALPQTHFTW